MQFDFEDYRPDTPRVETAMSRREGLVLSVFVHAAVFLFILFGPSLPTGGSRADAARLALGDNALRDTQRFFFVQPRVDTEALKPPPRAADADRNRETRSRERAPDPKNAQPFMRGSSPDLVEGNPAPPAAKAEPPADAGAGAAGESADASRQTSPPGGSALRVPDSLLGPAFGARSGVGSGALGEALRNLERYVGGESFENPQGSGPFGPEIQFNTRGVEFGPWVRRFVAQVKRNWFIPYAAMALRGHVVITFNVHKDGTISDLDVLAPCPVDSFNHAAYNALAASNPTQPLPPEYPADRAFFTVTFYYNETPPSY